MVDFLKKNSMQNINVNFESRQHTNETFLQGMASMLMTSGRKLFSQKLQTQIFHFLSSLKVSPTGLSISYTFHIF